MKAFETAKMGELLGRIAEAMTLHCPLRREAGDFGGHVVNFAEWLPGAGVPDFESLHTVRPPKEFFFRPYEALYTAEVSGGIGIRQERLPSEPFALFGVRACDLRGLELLDRVFLEEPADRFYEARRNAGAIVTLACARPGRACFCESFGIDRLNPGGDAQLSFLPSDSASTSGGLCLWETLTEKGGRLAEAAGGLLFDLDPGRAPDSRPAAAGEQAALPLPPAGRLLEIFNSDKWESLYRTCLGCGLCTYLCPTCQCYEIQGYSAGRRVKCHRAWDSCMNEDFTKMAHGNPRPGQKERFRQRFMHKLVYHMESGGRHGCTGCGRCAEKCPMGISMQRVMKTLGGA